MEHGIEKGPAQLDISVFGAQVGFAVIGAHLDQNANTLAALYVCKGVVDDADHIGGNAGVFKRGHGALGEVPDAPVFIPDFETFNFRSSEFAADQFGYEVTQTLFINGCKSVAERVGFLRQIGSGGNDDCGGHILLGGETENI